MNMRRGNAGLWPALFFFLLSLPSLAQTGAPQKVAEPSLRSIKGRVVSSDGQPVSSIQVSAVAMGKRPEAREMRGGLFSQTTTDEHGNFQFDGLQPAAYAISASSPGYVTLPPQGESSPNVYRLGDVAQITLVKGGVITGKVTAGDDEALTAVEVSAMRIGSIDGELDLFPGSSGAGVGFGRTFRTDDRGTYRIYGLTPGSYIVRASAPRNGGPNPSQEAPTYHPSATRDTAVVIPVRAGDEVSGIDIRYRGERGRSISGKVIARAGDGDRAGAQIVLATAGGGTVASTFQSLGRAEFERGGPQGRGPGGGGGFAFYGIPDGEYEISARTSGFRGESDAASTPRKITVRGADVSGIELTLNPLASIAGKLVIEKSAGVTACPVPRAYVIDEILIGTRRDGTEKWSRDEAPENNGEFTFSGIDAGTYRFRVRFPGENWYLKSLQMPSASTTSNVGKNGIVVKNGQRVTGLSAVVADGAASLAGQLMKTGEEKLADQWKVFLFPAETEAAENLLRFHQINTNNDGSFSIRNIAPGKYFLSSKPLAKEASRGEAQNFGQSIELAPCQRVTGFKVIAAGN